MLLRPVDYKHLLGRSDTAEIDFVLDDDIQPNGIDLRVSEIYDLNYFEVYFPFEKSPRITTHGNSWRVVPRPGDAEKLRLSKGFAYAVRSQLRFKKRIPNRVAAFVIGRSSFNRHGLLVLSTLYDTGYMGEISATLYCHTNAIVDIGCRFAQIVFVEADNYGVYQGQYLQKEVE